MIGLGVVVGVLLLLRFGPTLLQKAGVNIGGKGGAMPQLVVLKQDFDATVHFANLRRLGHYCDTLPEPQKTTGKKAVMDLLVLVGAPPEAPADASKPTDQVQVVPGTA
jgi:hypothetical protein